MIKRVLTSQEEKKYSAKRQPALQDSGTMTPIVFNSRISGTGEIYSLLPLVYEGTDSNGRIGQRIKPTALKTKITFSLLGEDAQARSIMVRCFILTAKGIKNASDYGSVPITTLLDPGAGEGGLVSFRGYLQDVQLPVNNEAFTVLHDYKFMMGKGLNPMNSSSGAVTNQIHDAFTQRSFVLKPPTLKYEGTGGIPTNYFPFMVIGYAYTDGTAPDTAGGILGVTYVSELHYTDS